MLVLLMSEMEIIFTLPATTYSLFFIDQQNSGFCETENRFANIIGRAAFKISLVNKWKHVAK